METRLRFFSSATNEKPDSLVLPVYQETILALQSMASAGDGFFVYDVVKKLKHDIGALLNFQAHLQKCGKDLVLDPAFSISQEQLNDFVNYLKNGRTDFLELQKIQTTAFKIGSFLTSFIKLEQNRLLFVDWLYPYSVFLANSFLAPSWIERGYGKIGGEFLNLLAKCIQNAPLKPVDVCELIFSNKSLVSKVTNVSSEASSLLKIGAALEPAFFWQNSVDLTFEWSNFCAANRQYLSPDILDLELEKFQKKWQLATNLNEDYPLTRNELLKEGKKMLADFHLRKNQNLVRNFDCEIDSLTRFFGELKQASPSVEAIRILIQEIAPQVGIEWVVVLLRDTRFLVPKLKWAVSMDFSPHPVSLSSYSQSEEFIIAAVQDLKVTKGGDCELFGLECSWYAVGFDYPHHKGAILAGFQIEDRRTIQVETYKLIANFRDLFGMALGYHLH